MGNAPSRSFRMDTNYRSPAEVFNLAAKVVVREYPQADLPTAVRTTGIAPLHLVAEDAELDDQLLTQTSALAEAVEGTIGVICPPSKLAQVQGLMQDQDRVRTITPLQSKGLEYDAVIVVYPDDIVAESPGGVRVLYVALTRPTQRLVTIDRAGRHPDWREFPG